MTRQDQREANKEAQRRRRARKRVMGITTKTVDLAQSEMYLWDEFMTKIQKARGGHDDVGIPGLHTR